MGMNDKTKILIADDSEFNREILIAMLGDEFDVFEAENGVLAVDCLREHTDEISLVLLDVMMPEMDGFGVLEMMNQYHWIEDIPVIMISAEDSSDFVRHAYEMGVTDYISRQMDALIIRKRVGNTIRLFAKQKRVLNMMEAENQSLMEKNYRLQNLDELTGCLNYDGFRSRVKQLLAEPHGKSYAVWYCDVKQFKFINDAFGYKTGDRLLRHLGQSIVDGMDEYECCGRAARDRMALLTYYRTEEELTERFSRIVSKVEHYLTQPGRNYEVEISAGIYLLKEEDMMSADASQLIDFAMVAQSEAKKKNGSRCSFFNEELWKKQQRALDISKHLKDALANREIRAWYQPQYDYVNKKISGAEALCRWHHSKLGWISPGEFIPVLEETGQITDVDHFIWEESCRYLKKWKDSGVDPVPLSVNISRKDIQGDVIYEQLTGLIQKYGLSPEMLRLEITESAYMDEPKQLIGAVRRLQELGFVVEMDDFGSGFSSLNMLKDVPVDILKLDMQFLGETDNEVRGSNILRAMIDMAHTLEIGVVAEGVETLAQAETLGSMGCDMMQGYYFSRPIPVEEFEEMLKK